MVNEEDAWDDPRDTLIRFLEENIDLWGNPYGHRIFSKAFAFDESLGFDQFGIPLKSVIHRLKTFRDNVKAAQDKQ